MTSPRVSVVLPTWNGKNDLEELLPVLTAQQVEGGHEILVVDSQSNDGSKELCEAAGVSVRTIDRSTFRHGGTRNLRAQDARGEFLVFLTQDALPQSSDFLAQLIAPMLSGEDVAGTWARIVPRPDDDALTMRTALAQPEAKDEALRVEGNAAWQSLPVSKQLERVRFNNVASAVRRSVFESMPFEDVAFGEDITWALSALEAGRTLCFAPSAVVAHAHRYGLSGSFERNRVDSAFQRLQFEHVVRPGILSFLRGWGFEVLADVRFILGRKPSSILQLLRSPFLRGAQVLGQLFGSKGWNLGSSDSATRRLN